MGLRGLTELSLSQICTNPNRGWSWSENLGGI